MRPATRRRNDTNICSTLPGLFQLALLLCATAIHPASGQIDIPGAGNATVAGTPNANNYNLTANALAVGWGSFTGNFNTNNNTLTVESQFPGQLVFDGVISGSSVSPLPSLSIFGAENTVVLNGNNTFTGDVLVQAGTLQLGHANALGAGSGITRNVGSATLDLNGQQIADEIAEFDNAHVFIVNSSTTAASWGGSVSFGTSFLTFTTTAGDITVSGNLTGSTSISKEGAYTLTISGDNSGLVDFWNLGNGTLRLGSNKSLGSGLGISGSNATLDLNGQAIDNKTLILLENGVVMNSSTNDAGWNGTVQILHSKNLTLDTTAGNMTFDGAISGNGSITKTGGNTLTLSSNSTSFTGDFIIEDGLAQFEGDSVFLIEASGINNSVTGSGDVYFSGTWIFDLTGAGTNVGDSWQILDVLSLGSYGYGTTFNILGFTQNGFVWDYYQSGTHYQFDETMAVLSVVPEPSAAWLIALAGLACFLRRRLLQSLVSKPCSCKAPRGSCAAGIFAR